MERVPIKAHQPEPRCYTSHKQQDFRILRMELRIECCMKPIRLRWWNFCTRWSENRSLVWWDDLFIFWKLNYEGWCSSLLFWQALDIEDVFFVFLDIVDIVSTTFCRLEGWNLEAPWIFCLWIFRRDSKHSKQTKTLVETSCFFCCFWY